MNITNEYINSLIENINYSKLPTTPINLIFDSGGINGIYGAGIALYIHNLEKKGYIKINKISGCSIGSVLALWYICGCTEDLYKNIELLFSHYIVHYNFYIFNEILINMVNHYFKNNEDVFKLNKKLYINYYDTKKHKQKVVSKFKSKKHLIKCIMRSCHVPFLTKNTYKCDNRYVDGFVPYIFKNTLNKNLFVQLISSYRPTNILFAKTEKNIYHRLLRGIIDASEFFIYGDSTMCCYIDDSSYNSYIVKLHLFIREYICIYILACIDFIFKIKTKIHHYIIS